MVLVPAGSSLTLRRADGTAVTMVTLTDVSAPLLDDLPALPVMSLEDPAARHAGVVELVSTSGVAWVEAELRGEMLRLLGDASDTLLQRRSSHRRHDHRPFTGVTERAGTTSVTEGAGATGGPADREIRFGGRVLNISASGVLLRAVTEADGRCLPAGVAEVRIEADMPWGPLPATVRVIGQHSEFLRGEFTGLPPSAAAELTRYCSER